MAITLLNNFNKLKDNFKSDTGLEANKENMSLYIQYYNARMNDMSYQIIHEFATQYINKTDQLPSKFRLELSDMLRTHEVIQEIRVALKK